MELFGLSVLMIIAIALLVWVFPILAIATSNRTRGVEKLAWILAVIFVSWFAWIFYLLLAPLRRT